MQRLDCRVHFFESQVTIRVVLEDRRCFRPRFKTFHANRRKGFENFLLTFGAFLGADAARNPHDSILSVLRSLTPDPESSPAPRCGPARPSLRRPDAHPIRINTAP